MAATLRPAAILFAFVALSSVTAQTFQYSRGWTNGKRDGHRHVEASVREMASNLERALSPCQMAKLRFVLEGKPLSERLLEPCMSNNVDDSEPILKQHFKTDRPADSIIDTYL